MTIMQLIKYFHKYTNHVSIKRLNAQKVTNRLTDKTKTMSSVRVVDIKLIIAYFHKIKNASSPPVSFDKEAASWVL